MDKVVNMECRKCGKRGDDIYDFIQTGKVGERVCPKCASDDCRILKQEGA